MKKLPLIGFASGIAANDTGCEHGPVFLQAGLLNHSAGYLWHEILFLDLTLTAKLLVVANICQRLAALTQQLSLEHQLFAVIGGDHSSAIGTWSGVHAALAGKALGLIWVDAHLDSHTDQTTLTGNIHGMPLASLLGYGAPKLTGILTATPKLLPQHVCVIGARSYESAEHELLKKLKVKIFYMEDIKEQGITAILQHAIAIATAGTAGFGLSIDLDGFDPLDAPGVGCPEPNGIAGQPFCHALQQLQHDPRLLGIEVVEFNPARDQQQRTAQLIHQLLAAITA